MTKKTKTTKVKSLGDDHASATTHSVFNLPKDVEKKSKVMAKDVFDMPKSKSKKKTKKKSSKVPKGSHRMPDGSIMKDSAMKKKSTKKKSTKKDTTY